MINQMNLRLIEVHCEDTHHSIKHVIFDPWYICISSKFFVQLGAVSCQLSINYQL